MAVLAFKVEADYEEVLRLRQEIDKLKSELKGINSSLNPGKFSEVNDKLRQTTTRFDEMKKAAADAGAAFVREGGMIDDALTKIAAGVAGAFAVDKIKDFVMEVVNVRGQFQQLEVAFKTMLGSGEKASKLMNQLVRTAATTPFDLQSVAQGAKQLLAYGTAAEDVNDTLIKLGDIAAGLSLPLGDLVYLYGTTVTQGRMFTQDMRQFMGRGIPMAEEIAKVMGVAEQEVAGLVTAGKVTADVFKKAIDGMAAEGGKFGGLMEAQSKTITGQISNIEDAVAMMFNKMGQQSEGVINTALSGVSYLVENYQEVGRQIGALVTAYGAYKAALITLTAIQRVNMAVLRQAALEKQLAAAQGIALSNAEALAAARTKLLALAQQGLVKAIKGVTAALASNPYTLAALAVAALTVGIYELATAESEAEKRTKAMNDAVDKQKKAMETFHQHNQDLINTATDETKSTYQRIAAFEELKQTMPGLIDKYKDLEALTKAMKEEGARPAALDSADIDKMKQDAEKWEGYLDALRKASGSISDWGSWESVGKSLRDRIDTTPEEAEAIVAKLKEAYSALQSSGADISQTLKGEAAELKDALVLVEGKVAATANVYEEAFARMKAASLADTQRKEQEAFEKTYNSAEKTQKAIGDYSNELDALKAKMKGNAFTVITDIVTKEKPQNWFQALKGRMNEITNANPLTISVQLEASRLESFIERLRNRLKGIANDSYGKAFADAEKAWKDARKLVSDMEKNKSSYTAEAYKEAKQDLDDNKKAFEALGGDTSTKTTTRSSSPVESAEERQARLRSAHQRTVDTVEKNAQDLKRKEEDLQYETDLARINAMQDGFDKEQQLRTLNHQKVLRDLDREQEDMVAAIKAAAKAEWDARENEEKEKHKKYVPKAFDWDKNATDEQRGQVASVVGLYGKRKDNQKAVNTAEDTAALNKALDQYKGYTEKRKDIEEKYLQAEADIRAKYKKKGKTGSEEESASLEEVKRQRAEAIESLDTEFAMRKEDFEIWANTVASFSIEQLENMLAEAEKKLDEMKNDAGASSSDLATLGAAIKTLLSALKDKKIQKAREEADTPPKKRTIEQWQKLSEALDSANQKFQEIGDSVGGVMGDIIKTTSEFSVSVLSMVNGIVSLATYSTEGIRASSQAAKTAIEAVEKASIILQVVSAAFQIATKIMSLFGANYDKYNEEKKAVEALSEVWDDVIAKKKEYIKMSYADEARKATAETISMLEKEAQAYRNLGKTRLNSGASAGSHSIGIRIKKTLMEDSALMRQFQAGLAAAGANYNDVIFGRMEGLFNLTSEQLEKLKTTAPEVWARLDSDARDYLDKLIEIGEQSEEVKNSLKESLTGFSFDSMKENFISNLMDMDYSAKDFANDVNKMFANALVTQMVNKNYKDKLQKVLDDMAEAIGSDNEQQRIEQIKKDYAAMSAAAKEEADKIMDITGYGESSQQSGDSGGFEAMSQDTAEELSGRFTMLQVTAQNQYQRITEISGSLSGMLSIVRDTYNIHNDARTILAEGLLELRTISENTAINKKMLPILESIEKKVKTSL
jgi:hypothetical protein